jgi:hypothetical protein
MLSGHQMLKINKANTLKIIIAILFIPLFVPHISLALDQPLPEHYCNDEKSWQSWDHILNSNPGNDEVASLYAFRVGLCSMVKSGQIETIRATQLFERMRDIVLKGMKEDEAEIIRESGPYN